MSHLVASAIVLIRIQLGVAFIRMGNDSYLVRNVDHRDQRWEG